MLEEFVGKRIAVAIEEGSNSRTVYGILLQENEEYIKLEMNDGTIFTINKNRVISSRPFKESGNHG